MRHFTDGYHTEKNNEDTISYGRPFGFENTDILRWSQIQPHLGYYYAPQFLEVKRFLK